LLRTTFDEQPIVCPWLSSCPAACLQLHERSLQLQLSIQRMANIKEFRTPQVRAAGPICLAV
jgi:hypothetical protein